MQCHLYFHPSIHLSSIFQFIYHTQSIYFFWHLSKQIAHRERDVSFPGLFPPCSTKNSLQLTESVSISQHFDFPNCSNALPWSALINAVWSITSGSASVSNRLRSNGTRSFHRKKKKKVCSAGGIKRQHLYLLFNYHWGDSLHLVDGSRAARSANWSFFPTKVLKQTPAAATTTLYRQSVVVFLKSLNASLFGDVSVGNVGGGALEQMLFLSCCWNDWHPSLSPELLNKVSHERNEFPFLSVFQQSGLVMIDG